MANMDNPFQPAIDALETELVEVERNANALLTTINLLRSKAGMPPREPGGGIRSDVLWQAHGNRRPAVPGRPAV